MSSDARIRQVGLWDGWNNWTGTHDAPRTADCVGHEAVTLAECISLVEKCAVDPDCHMRWELTVDDRGGICIRGYSA